MTARFVDLGGDVWVNVAHVVAVGPREGVTLVETVNGTSQPVDLTVAEVVALLTGESEPL